VRYRLPADTRLAAADRLMLGRFGGGTRVEEASTATNNNGIPAGAEMPLA